MYEVNTDVESNDQGKEIQKQFDDFIGKRGMKFKDSIDIWQKGDYFRQKHPYSRQHSDNLEICVTDQIIQFNTFTIVSWSVNLTANGDVSPVKNQGSCGSCWAFAAVGSLQFLSLNKTNTQVDHSEQQYVDCVYTTSGCDGGCPSTALLYTKANGSQLETNYNYTANTLDHALFKQVPLKLPMQAMLQDPKLQQIQQDIQQLLLIPQLGVHIKVELDILGLYTLLSLTQHFQSIGLLDKRGMPICTLDQCLPHLLYTHYLTLYSPKLSLHCFCDFLSSV